MSFRRGLRCGSTTRFIQNASHWRWGREAMETDARSGASGGWRQRWARRAGPALRRAATAATPGPGSPVATTCTC